MAAQTETSRRLVPPAPLKIESAQRRRRQQRPQIRAVSQAGGQRPAFFRLGLAQHRRALVDKLGFELYLAHGALGAANGVFDDDVQVAPVMGLHPHIGGGLANAVIHNRLHLGAQRQHVGRIDHCVGVLVFAGAAKDQAMHL